ncbi:MAG: hypothetical protein LRY73_06535 [Bacillus sp. (in: Bacteria)]|nr:hypothetical protein [Bacillus sp. (in: firmicutes)]
MRNVNGELKRRQLTHGATALFVIGAILFVIGSSMLYYVSKEELDETVRGQHESNNLFT